MSVRLLLAANLLFAAVAWAQPGQPAPQIGYVYPAGGQKGTVVQVVVGGQHLRGAKEVFVSGEGVEARIVQYYRPLRNIDREQREALQRRYNEVRAKRLAEMGDAAKAPPAGPAFLPRGVSRPAADDDKAVALPPSPLLYGMDDLSLQELEHVKHVFFTFSKRQPNAQIAESVLLEVVVQSNADPGDRELRILAGGGLTNPMRFQVGSAPEVREYEPNDPHTLELAVDTAPTELPVTFNGQILPGDVDRLRFKARKNQDLVIKAQARRLIPYLADGVPGWFQAVLSLYDARGVEVAFADDHRFDPDPVIFYRVPEDGEYVVEIRDSIYRGREDFVYRITVGEQPFIMRAFPLGGAAGGDTTAVIAGYNLPADQLRLDTRPGGAGIRHAVLRTDSGLSNRVVYAVDSLPELREIEPNDAPESAQALQTPCIVNGRIAHPGDVDIFRFEGRAGDEIVAEVMARRLQSPLDSLLRLTDASGEVLAWNDDHEDRESGLLTHQADSYLRARLPKPGAYFVELSDAQHQGGDAYAYRLRIGPPQPDFALRVTPSSINVTPGRYAEICVHALRKDGFDGAIDIALKGAPPGFALNGGRIPAGRDRVRMTLAAPRNAPRQPFVLNIEGRARSGDATVVRPAIPAEDMMQAFIYQHLVPSQELMVATLTPRQPLPPVTLAGSGPLRIPAGGRAQVRVNAPRAPVLDQVRLELSEPPEGVSLSDLAVVPEGLAFTLTVDAAAKTGYQDNIIVEAYLEPGAPQPNLPPARQNQRVSLGVLPAIPVEIVQPN